MQDILNMYLAHDTIQKMNCVIGYFCVKKKLKLAKIVDLQLCGSLKWDRVYKKWKCWDGPF